MMVKLEIHAMKFQLLCTSRLEIVCKFCVFFFLMNYGKKGLCVWTWVGVCVDKSAI